jgi:hypothetical protein
MNLIDKYIGEGNMGLHLMKVPSGKWAFKGSVPAHLAWEKKGGGRLSDKDMELVSTVSTPAMIASTRVFKSKEEALKAAKKEGVLAKMIKVYDK